MHYPHPLIPVRLIKRYKRFLADVITAQGDLLTVHCANPGSMRGIIDQFPLQAWIYDSQNPKRKLSHSLEAVVLPDHTWVNLNTHRANEIVYEALQQQVFPWWSTQEIKREVTWHDDTHNTVKTNKQSKTRFDFQITTSQADEIYIEIKSVTYSPQPQVAAFPDAVSTRSHKHLQTLMDVQKAGKQAYLIFCVQRTDAHYVTAAKDIDPTYAHLLQQAHKAGVQIHAYVCTMDQISIQLSHEIPVLDL